VGVIFYELLHRKTPWAAKSVYDLVKRIETVPLKLDEKLSPATKDFLTKTLGHDEKSRISWEDVFRHKIFEGYFDSYVQNVKEIENKLKTIMSRLRFRINSDNIDVRKLLSILGLQSEKDELNFKEFHRFLEYIYNDLTEEEVRYFFDRVDEDNSGTISVAEI
jgi:serine/threonine protein kinase